MPVINIEVLQDIWGGSTDVDARITATVNRASIDAYRVNNQFVIFPRDLIIPVVDGFPTRPFILTQLPAGYYWHIDVYVSGEAPLRRSVIVPSGDGPFDFEDLIDVDPNSAEPDTSQDLYQAWLDQIEAALNDPTIVHYTEGASGARAGSGQIIQFTNNAMQSIITGPDAVAGQAAQRLVVQGQDGSSTGGEGGDVYVWAGSGLASNATGGDVKLDAGQGIGTGEGGTVKVRGGYTPAGTGGSVEITSGYSTDGTGGSVHINASGGGVTGGDIQLNTFNNVDGQRSWTFNDNGIVTFPDGSTTTGSSITSNASITLSGASGEFINDSTNPDNQIATVGDLAAISLIPGPQGDPGPAGAPGATGATGPGVAAGGVAGQILSKIDATDYNTTWIDNFTSEVKHLVKAGEAISKGTPVYVSTADGTNMIVMKSSNAAESTSSKTMGLLAQDLALNETGYVITEGLIAGLNTNSANAGDPVWLGVNGALIYGLASKPTAPAHLVYIGSVTRKQINNGEIMVKIQNGFEAHELHDFQLEAYASIVDNELIAFDTASQNWKNQTPAEAGLIAVNTNAVVKTVNEAFTTINGATGVVAHDYSTGAIFNHTAPAANFTANITNLVLASGYGTSITIVLNQGATGRIPSALQIGGVAQTINWQGGAAPTGNANKKDVVSFSILNVSGTYTVLGQLVSFG